MLVDSSRTEVQRVPALKQNILAKEKHASFCGNEAQEIKKCTLMQNFLPFFIYE